MRLGLWKFLSTLYQILSSLSSWGTVAINSVWIAFKSMFGSKYKRAGSTSSVLRYIQGNRPIVASQCLFQCTEGMHPNDISLLCGEDHGLLLLYESLMMRRVLAQDPDTRWCPAPNCTFAVVAAGCASCPRISCEREGCEASFCYHCKAEWHPNQTCDLARAQRQRSFDGTWFVPFCISTRISFFLPATTLELGLSRSIPTQFDASLRHKMISTTSTIKLRNSIWLKCHVCVNQGCPNWVIQLRMGSQIYLKQTD